MAGTALYAAAVATVAVGAITSGAGIAVTVAGPLGGFYTSKVIAQMAEDDYHGFPILMDRVVAEEDGVTTVGNDGQTYTQVNLPGCINGAKGTFQWIMDQAGQINHRFFQPGD